MGTRIGGLRSLMLFVSATTFRPRYNRFRELSAVSANFMIARMFTVLECRLVVTRRRARSAT